MATNLPDRPGSPVREMEPDFNVLERAPLTEERKLPVEELIIEHRLFQEENGIPTCFALKAHNSRGYSFYIKGDKLPYTLEAGDPIYVVKRRPNDIPSSAKEGLMTAVGLEINGLVFEKSNELVIVIRKGYDYEENTIIRTTPRETSPHYLVYPVINYNDFFEVSPDMINVSIKRATDAINKNSASQCFEGISETIETLDKYKDTVVEFSDVCRRFLIECHSALNEMTQYMIGWEGRPPSEERETKLRILRANIYERRKAESRLIPFTRVIVDKKHCLEQAIEESVHLRNDLRKTLEQIHNVVFSTS